MMNPERTALAILACLLAAAAAPAQAATEIFIPIGKSPGCSGRLTAIGRCTAVEAREQLVTVRAGERTWTGKVTEQTRIYLDRSRLGLPNTYGTFADLNGELLMEIKYRPGERADGAICEWIKIQVVGERRR
jgi:hypothetical protein